MNQSGLQFVKGRDYIGVGVGAIVINEKNEVLLLLRKRNPEANFWSIPGGSVEFGELLENAILRELEEEIGVQAKILRQVKTIDRAYPVTRGGVWAKKRVWDNRTRPK